MQAYTLIYPDTVVVHLFDAKAAHCAMFRPGWLLNFAGAALLSFFKDDIVELEPSQCSDMVWPIFG